MRPSCGGFKNHQLTPVATAIWRRFQEPLSVSLCSGKKTSYVVIFVGICINTEEKDMNEIVKNNGQNFDPVM
jgi:hypothetical protein